MDADSTYLTLDGVNSLEKKELMREFSEESLKLSKEEVPDSSYGELGMWTATVKLVTTTLAPLAKFLSNFRSQGKVKCAVERHSKNGTEKVEIELDLSNKSTEAEILEQLAAILKK